MGQDVGEHLSARLHEWGVRRVSGRPVRNAGERVALVAGAGALQATDEVFRMAEANGAGVAKSLPGEAAVPGDLPLVTGTVGRLGTRRAGCRRTDATRSSCRPCRRTASRRGPGRTGRRCCGAMPTPTA